MLPENWATKGYADRVLTGMHLFDMQLSEADYDRVQLRYIATDSKEALALQLNEWDKQGVSPYTDKAYERRLLVLTDAEQLPMLTDMPLGPTDEVLVMNTTDSVFAHIPRKDWLGPRLHALSISAADAARKYCHSIEDSNGLSSWQPSIFHLLSCDDPRMMADSIQIVLSEYFEGKASLGSYARVSATTLTDSYLIAGTTINVLRQTTDDIHLVCSWGAHNAAIFAYAYTQDIGDAELLFLDTDFAGLSGFTPCIVRHYDRALCQWLERWLDGPAASMPATEWHGAWDGYVTDNINYNFPNE